MNDNFHLSEDDKMTVLVSCEAPGVIQALEKRGVRVLTVDICEQLDVPVRSHADMQVLPLDDCVLISPYQTRLKTQLEQMNLRVIVGEELEKKYPKDVLYNVCLVGNHYICNYKTISRQAQQLLDARGYHPIFVAQGYANCSVAVVDEQLWMNIRSSPLIAGSPEPVGLPDWMCCRFVRALSGFRSMILDLSADAAESSAPISLLLPEGLTVIRTA